jgi:hypothetical protein
MAGFDAENREAITLIVRRLQADHGDARPLGGDAEPFAQEIVAALRGLGWRPVHAVPASADWRRARGSGNGTPDPSGSGGAEYLAAKAAMRARTGMTGPQSALTEEAERELLREGHDP